MYSSIGIQCHEFYGCRSLILVLIESALLHVDTLSQT